MSHNDVSDAYAERGATIANRLQGICSEIHPNRFDILGPYQTRHDDPVSLEVWNVVERVTGGHRILCVCDTQDQAKRIRNTFRALAALLGVCERCDEEYYTKIDAAMRGARAALEGKP